MSRGKRILKHILVLAFWLGLWALVSQWVGRELLMPAPWTVLRRLGQLVVTAAFWRTTAISLVRILWGAGLAVLAGVVLAVATNRFALLKALLAPLLTIVRSTPVASFILLLLIWVGRDILPSVIVFVMVLPVVWSNLSAGLASVDGSYLQLCSVYRLPFWRRVRRVYVPSVMPYFLSACQTAFGLAWKAGVAAEVLTVPKYAIGRMLYESKLYLETVDLFAWTVVVILCSLGLEKLLTWGFGRLSRRYAGKGGQRP